MLETQSVDVVGGTTADLPAGESAQKAEVVERGRDVIVVEGSCLDVVAVDVLWVLHWRVLQTRRHIIEC